MALESAAEAQAGTLTGQPMAPRATAVPVPALTYWRVWRAMLQRELAGAVGVDLRTIQRLEAGGNAGLDTIRHLAEALRVEPSDLMREPPRLVDDNAAQC